MAGKKEGGFWKMDTSLKKHFEEFEKYVNSFTDDIFRIFNVQPFLATVKTPFDLVGKTVRITYSHRDRVSFCEAVVCNIDVVDGNEFVFGYLIIRFLNENEYGKGEHLVLTLEFPLYGGLKAKKITTRIENDYVYTENFHLKLL